MDDEGSATIVLATGDAATVGYGLKTIAVVERALKKGRIVIPAPGT